MVVSLISMLPTPEALLALEPEELAGVLLQHLNSLEPRERNNLNRHNFGMEHTVRDYPSGVSTQLLAALLEAWVWLEREGLLVPKPGSDGWSIISRRGQRLTTKAAVDSYRHGNLLPREQLHPTI